MKNDNKNRVQKHNKDVEETTKTNRTKSSTSLKETKAEARKLMDAVAQKREQKHLLKKLESKQHHEDRETLLLAQKTGNYNLIKGNLDSMLVMAAGLGNVDLCQKLIDKGAQLDWLDCEDNSALIVAARGRHIDVIKLLLDSGANADFHAAGRHTVLFDEISFSIHTDTKIIEILLEAGANPNLQLKDGRSPLTWALALEIPKIVYMFLKYGAEIDKDIEDAALKLTVC